MEIDFNFGATVVTTFADFLTCLEAFLAILVVFAASLEHVTFLSSHLVVTAFLTFVATVVNLAVEKLRCKAEAKILIVLFLVIMNYLVVKKIILLH